MTLRETAAQGRPRAEGGLPAGLIVAAAAAAVFAASLRGGFLYDDLSQIPGNPWLREGAAGIVKAFTHHLAAYKDGPLTGFYRPLMHTLNILVFQVAGLAPLPYHAASVALHAGVSVLLLRLLRLLGAAPGAALAGALAFALHPVHVESVAWIGGSHDLLLALFSLAAIAGHLALPVAGWGGWRAAVPAAALALALFSKETALVLPPLLVGGDLLLGRFPRGGRDLALRYGPPAAVLAAYLAARVAVLGSLLPEGAGAAASPAHQAAGMIQALGWHLQRILFPAGYSFCSELPLSASPLRDAATWLGAGVIVSVLGAWAWFARRRPVARWGLLAFLLPLAPVLVPVTALKMPLADRYLYLPSAGFCALLAAAAAGPLAAGRWRRRAVLAGLALLLAAYGWTSFTRTALFRSEAAFWGHALGRPPAEPAPAGWRGGPELPPAALDGEAIAEALREGLLGYSAAANAEAMAGILLERGLPAAAAAHLGLRMRIAPPTPTALALAGDLRLAAGDPSGAALEYLRALELPGAGPGVLHRLGSAFERSGDLPDALRAYEGASRAVPGRDAWREDAERVRRALRAGSGGAR